MPYPFHGILDRKGLSCRGDKKCEKKLASLSEVALKALTELCGKLMRKYQLNIDTGLCSSEESVKAFVNDKEKRGSPNFLAFYKKTFEIGSRNPKITEAESNGIRNLLES